MSTSSRLKPVLGHDNGWWWEMAADGKLGIQRCSNCHALRHPPRPMCGRCRSLNWDRVEASGKGIIYSYTILTHPKFPGYSYPLVIILVELAEGTRFTSQLIDCNPEDVTFGLPVEMVIHEDPDGFRIPVFRLSGVS